ncbi:MAG: transcription elongation factor GreB [Bdellovibrionales bacterium]|nr:transcription elongation factor GreB [Bdellovibrionales bacterium]
MSKNYITKNGFEAMRSEFHELLYVERPKVVEVVAWAASNGDRSENGDYLYGKKRLREIDRRVRYLKNRLEDAEVVDPKVIVSEKIVFSATVKIADEDGNEKTYQVVGEDEIDPNKGLISWKSPIGKALLGREVGDEVKIHLPKGETYLEILAVEFL